MGKIQQKKKKMLLDTQSECFFRRKQLILFIFSNKHCFAIENYKFIHNVTSSKNLGKINLNQPSNQPKEEPLMHDFLGIDTSLINRLVNKYFKNAI